MLTLMEYGPKGALSERKNFKIWFGKCNWTIEVNNTNLESVSETTIVGGIWRLPSCCWLLASKWCDEYLGGPFSLVEKQTRGRTPATSPSRLDVNCPISTSYWFLCYSMGEKGLIKSCLHLWVCFEKSCSSLNNVWESFSIQKWWSSVLRDYQLTEEGIVCIHLIINSEGHSVRVTNSY